MPIESTIPETTSDTQLSQNADWRQHKLDQQVIQIANHPSRFLMFSIVTETYHGTETESKATAACFGPSLAAETIL